MNTKNMFYLASADNPAVVEIAKSLQLINYGRTDPDSLLLLLSGQ